MNRYKLQRTGKIYTAKGLLKLRTEELVELVQKRIGADAETAKMVLFEALHKNVVIAELLDRALFVHDKERFYREQEQSEAEG